MNWFLCIEIRNLILKNLIDFRDRKNRKRERHWFVVPLTDAFIGWLLYVPWPGTEPTTLAGWDNALNNWATWLGPKISFLNKWNELYEMQLNSSCFLHFPWYLQPAKLVNAYVCCYYKAALKNLWNSEF